MTWKPLMNLVTDPVHAFFLKMAYQRAFDCSEDLQTKVGAVVVEKRSDGYYLISSGVNQLLRVDETNNYSMEDEINLIEKLNDRAWKYEHMIHAEHNAIENTLLSGHDTNGKMMYMPWVPCEPCAKRIKLAKISKLITHKSMVLKTPERWQDSTNRALDILLDAGVELYMYQGELTGVQSVFSGELWSP